MTWTQDDKNKAYCKRIWILLIGLCFTCQTHAATIQLTPAEKQWLAAHPEIKVAPDPDYPPFEFINDQGAHQGLAADYLKLVGQRLGIQFRIMHLASWDACLKQAEKREVDMWSAAAPTPPNVKLTCSSLNPLSNYLVASSPKTVATQISA